MYYPKSPQDAAKYYRSTYDGQPTYGVRNGQGQRTLMPWEMAGYNGPGSVPRAADVPPGYQLPMKPASTQPSVMRMPEQPRSTVGPWTLALADQERRNLPASSALTRNNATQQVQQHGVPVQQQDWYRAEQERIAALTEANRRAGTEKWNTAYAENQYAQRGYAPPEMAYDYGADGTYQNLMTYYERLRREEADANRAARGDRYGYAPGGSSYTGPQTGDGDYVNQDYINSALEQTIRKINEKYAANNTLGSAEHQAEIAEARRQASVAAVGGQYKNPYLYFNA